MKTSVPKIVLHFEGLAILAAACWLYAHYQYRWSWFALGFLAPDLFAAGYLVNKQVGSACYNLVHTYVAPLLLAAVLVLTDRTDLGWIVLIWISHIAWDRLLGYGLKYETAFKMTHLQKV